MQAAEASRPNPNAAYTRTAIALHWLIAALIVCGFALGWVMTDLAVSPQKLKFYAWHKWIGMTVLALAALRSVWRLRHRPPPPLAMPAWQHVAAQFAHGLLYALMFAQPLSGWLYSSASGYSVVYLQLLRLPDLVAKNKDLAIALKQVHVGFGWCLAATLGVHAAAALKHHLIDRDATLLRMLSWRRSPVVPQKGSSTQGMR